MSPPAVADRAAASHSQLLHQEFANNSGCAGVQLGDFRLETDNAEVAFQSHAFIHPLLLPLLPSVYAFTNPSWPPAPKKKRSAPTAVGGTLVYSPPTKSPTVSCAEKLAISQVSTAEPSRPARRTENCPLHGSLLRCARCEYSWPVKKRKTDMPLEGVTQLDMRDGSRGDVTGRAGPHTFCGEATPERLTSESGQKQAESISVEMSTALFCLGAAAPERDKKLEGQKRGTVVRAVSVANDQSRSGHSPSQSGCWNAPASPTRRRSDSSPQPHTVRAACRTRPCRRADESDVGSVALQRRDNTAEDRSPDTGAWRTAHSPCTPRDRAPASTASDVLELSSDRVVCVSQSIPLNSELSGEAECRLSGDATSPCRNPVKCTLLPSIGCGLTVSASSLGRGSGLGVYACRSYSARSRVGEYAGVCVDRKVAMMLRGMGTSTHVMRVGMQYQYLVGYRLPFLFAGGGAFVNDGRWFADGRKGPGVSVRFHVAYDKKRAKDRVYVVATKDIEAGEEIFTSYDNQYWALLR